MALTKAERRAIEKLADYVTLQRASLTPPARAIERGYGDSFAHGRDQVERGPRHPSRVTPTDDLPPTGNAWTEDVAASLRLYLDSWALPIIDLLLEEPTTLNGHSSRRMRLEDASQ